MKRSTISVPIIAFCIMVFLMMSSFMTIPSVSTSKSVVFDEAAPITFFGSITGGSGTTYTGFVQASGAINATGTFVMPTESLGMALHCIFILTFPTGTITIRMNCNMVTFNGEWQIIGATGAYQNLKGGGSLVMPNDTDEILTGTLRGL